MKTIILLRPRSANYTPADLMLAFARDAKSEYVKAERVGKLYGELRLTLSGVTYRYHHWQIDRLPGEIDRITLFLEEVAK